MIYNPTTEANDAYHDFMENIAGTPMEKINEQVLEGEFLYYFNEEGRRNFFNIAMMALTTALSKDDKKLSDFSDVKEVLGFEDAVNEILKDFYQISNLDSYVHNVVPSVEFNDVVEFYVSYFPVEWKDMVNFNEVYNTKRQYVKDAIFNHANCVIRGYSTITY